MLVRAVPEMTKWGGRAAIDFFCVGGRIFSLFILSVVGLWKKYFSWVIGQF